MASGATRSSISSHRLPSPAPSDDGAGDASSKPADVEQPDSISQAPDPYCLRNSLKTDDELQVLRKRGKTGKEVEAYHKKQNEVRRHWG